MRGYFFLGQSEGVVATPKAWTAGCAATEGCELRDNLFGEVMRKMPHPACGKSKQDLSRLAHWRKPKETATATFGWSWLGVFVFRKRKGMTPLQAGYGDRPVR